MVPDRSRRCGAVLGFLVTGALGLSAAVPLLQADMASTSVIKVGSATVPARLGVARADVACLSHRHDYADWRAGT